MSIPPRITYVIIIAVTAAWLILTGASIFVDDVRVPEEINGLFMLIAGAAVAQVRPSKKDEKDAKR